jgi:predicted acyl esterase
MSVRSRFARRVRELSNVWIPARDGTRLAARIWLPDDAASDPVPAILEAIPYRKGDWTAARDAVRHPWFAGHGYAVVRLDLRGTGDSEGILEDEYLEQEQEDLEDAVAWLAGREWCTGAVGMFGISWGGFNGLQLAARRPPALRAVVTVCSTDDRYADDVHYMGGCVLGIDMLPWASQMLVWNACPPDPRVAGEGWRELWLERLERTPPYVEAWLAHQRRDAYWRHGSVCEDYGAIECAVLAVGGWADGYTNAVFRLLEGLECPRKAIVGPWAHGFPEEGLPGPAIGFLQECLRWWDRWLRNVDTGVENDPDLRVYLEEWVPGRAHHETVPGRWVTEPEWPPPSRESRLLHLAPGGRLAAEQDGELVLALRGSLLCGLDSGLWCPYGDAADMPTDQRVDDGLSLAFDTAPLDESVELLGSAEARLTVASDRPNALVAVRLCDVAPTGESTLVTRGLLNLTHRESHESPAALEPGRPYEVTVRLNAAGHAFAAGHRLRLAVSPTYWPMAWPSPEPVTLELLAGGLALPIRSAVPVAVQDVAWDEPELAEPLAVEALSGGHASRTVTRDLATGSAVLTYAYGGGRRRLPSGVEIADDYREVFRIAEDDPLSARIETDHAVELAWDGVRVRVEARSSLTCDAGEFRIANAVDAFENGALVFSASREVSVPRDLV